MKHRAVIQISLFILLIFISLVTNAQEATSSRSGGSWIIRSSTRPDIGISTISINPSGWSPTPRYLKGIRMTTGGYPLQAPVDIIPGGDINLIAGYTGNLGVPVIDRKKGANANINMTAGEMFVYTRAINLSSFYFDVETNSDKPLKIRSNGQMDINSNDQLKITSNEHMDINSGSLSIKTQGMNISSDYFAKIYGGSEFTLESANMGKIKSPNFYIKNGISQFRLNHFGQFFMFDSDYANDDNVVAEFTVEGLDVSNYKLFIQGGVLAEKVRVQTNWADYVFDSDYKLKTLVELEKYIEENKHLPNVPSAKEVEKTGIEIGDITRIQQEKIEELTLYTIAQEKKLKNQDVKNQELEAKNMELEARLDKLEQLLIKK